MIGQDPTGECPRDAAEDERLVAEHAARMLAKLAVNRYKAHWSTMAPGQLLCRLRDEVWELRDAMASGDPAAIALEAADVSNFAAMIADHFKPKESP